MSAPAPFTTGQVEAIKAWQACTWVHPLTCANRGDGDHVVTTDLGVLEVDIDGLFCPSCDYTQKWVPENCVRPLPPDPFAPLR